MPVEREEIRELRIVLTVDGMRQAERELAGINESLGDSNKIAKDFQRSIHDLNNELGGTGKAARDAERGLAGLRGEASAGSKEWQQLKKDVSDASEAYRAFRRNELTGTENPAGKGVASHSIDQLRGFLATADASSASFLSEARRAVDDYDKSMRDAEQATKDWATAQARLEEIQRTTAANDANEAHRQREIAEAIRQRAAAEKVLADSQAIRVSNSAFMGDNLSRGNVVGQGNKNNPGAVPAAASTGLAAMLIAEEEAEKRHVKVLGEVTAAQDRAAAATDRRVRAEMGLARANSRRDNRAATAAWDAEFASLTKLTTATDNYSNGSLPRLRYALYDVATTYGILSAATLAASTLVLKTSADFESSFSNVERTVEPGAIAVGTLKDSLIDLSTEIPKSFDELSQIATLGNQLGIEAENITSFTGTVARFSTIAGVSAQETAQAFGSMTAILGVQAPEYENLGSAIALVGRNSVATEAEILSLTREIGQQAHAAGFSADQVVALSGTLGELRVPPERSRGALTTYFQTLNQAVAEGGDKLENFAKVIGVSAGELDQMVRGGKGVEIFQRFLDSLQNSDAVDVTTALDELGLSQLRVSDTFQRLAGSSDTFNQFLGQSAAAYADGGELARQYEIILDDLNTQMQLLWQSILALLDAGAGDLIPGLSSLVGSMADFVNGAREFADTDLGGTFFRVGLAVVAAIGIFAAFRTASYLATASVAALTTAQIELASAGKIGGIRGLIGAMLGVRTAATQATGALAGTATATTVAGGAAATSAGRFARFSGVLAGVGKSLGWLAILTYAVQWLTDFNGTAAWSVEVLANINEAFAHVVGGIANFNFAMASTSLAIAGAADTALRAIPIFGGIADIISDVGYAIATAFGGAYSAQQQFSADALNTAGYMRDWATEFRGAGASADVYTGSVDGAADAMDGGVGSGEDFADTLGDVGGAAGAAAEELHTVADYANELSGVFDRSFDLRFGGQESLDAIASSWNTLNTQVEEANKQVAEYKATMASLASDKAITEFWLAVAEGYGDTLRADKLRAELGEINNSIAENNKSLSTAQDKASMSTEGNSQAAIDNRAALTSLVGQYQAYVVQLADSGLNQQELTAAVAKAKEEFIRQATQLGYSRTEVDKYALAFDDLIQIIAQVPRNVTTEMEIKGLGPAKAALKEFEGAAREAARNAQNALSGVSFPGLGDSSGTRQQALMARIRTAIAYLDQLRTSGNISGAVRYSDVLSGLQNDLRFGNYWTGGYTGDGGVREAVGFVHGKEFVFDAKATAAIGPDTLYALQDAARRGKTFGVGDMAFAQAPSQGQKGLAKSTGATGPNMVSLSPLDRDLLLRIERAVGVTIGYNAFADAAGAGFSNSSSRGDG